MSVFGQPTEIRVAVIELNHCYDKHGDHKFDQLILWDYSPDWHRTHVIQWQFLSREIELRPGQKLAILRREGREVWIKGGIYRETWTIRDPERANVAVFPHKYRRAVCKSR